MAAENTSIYANDARSEEESPVPRGQEAPPALLEHVVLQDPTLKALSMRKRMEIMSLDPKDQSRDQEVNTEAGEKSHQFWNTQPCTQYGDVIETSVNTFIEDDVDPAKIRKEPYSLPEAFEWSDINLDNAEHLKDLYTLLTENYVEDNQCKFRFDYSPKFLDWTLRVPGWIPNLLCGVRAKMTGRLVAFISSIPQNIRVYDKVIRMGEINFLCVHKQLRGKKVAPVLIREITRRANLLNFNQAVYTAGIVLPRPIAFCQYHHRSLNPKKLVACGFSTLSSMQMTLARATKLYRVAKDPKTKGIRPIEERDIPQAHNLLNDYLSKFNIAPVYSEAEFKYNFLSREKVIYSYVVENSGIVTDFISFYCLPSTVMDHPVYKSILGAYLYYHAATVTPLKDLVADCFVFAQNNGFDVFNALDCMDNEDFFADLKFGNGTGRLQYYLYNWKCAPMIPSQVGLILHHEETGQLFLSFKQFPVDEWNREATPSKYPNVNLRPSAFPFNFKRNSFQEDASTSENWTLVRNSITSLRPQKSSKRSFRTKGYRESFRKRVCSVDVIYRKSFLINDDDIEKWKNYQAYNVNILQEQPPDVPLRTTSLFCDKEEDKNRSPSVFVPINGPLLLQPSKSFEKKAKKAVKRRNSLSSDFLTKTFEILKKYMNMDSIFGRKKSNTLKKVQNTSSSSSSSTVEWTARQVRQ